MWYNTMTIQEETPCTFVYVRERFENSLYKKLRSSLMTKDTVLACLLSRAFLSTRLFDVYAGEDVYLSCFLGRLLEKSSLFFVL